MKKLITILMCLQMIVAPVLAQTTTTTTETPKSTSAGDQFREKPDAKKQGGSFMNQILGISQAAVGTSAIMMCKTGAMLPSIMIYMAGSLAYIASELLGGKAKGDALKRKSSDLKMVEEKMKKNGGGGDVQKEALEQALKDEEDNLAFVKKRKMWLMAIAAIYTAAAAMAMIEKIRLVTTLAIQPGGYALAAALPPPFMAGMCSPEGALGGAMVAKGVAAAYAILIGMKQESSIGKYGSMLAALLAVVTPLGATIAGALQTPMGRTVIFAAHAALVAMIMSDLSSKEGTFKENIKKLKAAIADFEKDAQPTNGIAADTSTTSGSTDGSSQSDSATTAGSLNGSSSSGSTTSGSLGATTSGSSNGGADVNGLASGTGASSKMCWSQTSEGMSYSEVGCSNPVKLAAVKFDANLNVPTLSTAAGLATDMAQGFAEGNVGKAEVAAGSLASMAGSINQVRDNLLKQMNDKLKESGEKTVDLDAEVNKQLESMNGVMNSTLGTDNPNSTLLGSYGNGTTVISADESQKTDAEKSAIGSASSDKTIGAAGAGINTANANNTLGISEGISDSSAANSDANVQTTLSENLNNFEMNESDIASDADGVSLFKQVSNRYLMSYPKILQRKQIAPVPAPNPNNPPN